jgi:cytochrome c553
MDAYHRASWISSLIFCCTFLSSAVSAQGMDARRESEQLYLQMHKVLSHPRCVNCHPKDDTPKQGEAARVHVPPMTRGPQSHGPAGLQCGACHQEQNNAASGVPGAPLWHLAPRSMAWRGLSAGELCRALIDRKKNGNRSIEATVKHLSEDALVAWAWHPGTDASGKAREPVPVPREEFIKTVQAWAKLGAVCPK